MTLQQPNAWHSLSATLPAGERVYAIGDIQGCDALLSQMHERISLDRKLRTIRRATLVYLGDYTGPGPASRQVLDRVLDTPGWADSVVRLLGNQETVFLDALAGGPLSSKFFKTGGLETLRSYGVVQDAPLLRIVARKELLKAVRTKIPSDHMEFFGEGADRFVLGDYFFCHGGVTPGLPLSRQTRADVQTTSDEFLASKADFGAFVVHGRRPTAAPVVRANGINLNTGAYAAGRLTCGVFEDNRVKFITTTGAMAGIAQAHAQTHANAVRSRVSG